MSEGVRGHGQHGAQGPRMHVPKSIPDGYQEFIPDSEIYVSKFKTEDPEVSCSRCDFGTGSHACWRGEYQR